MAEPSRRPQRIRRVACLAAAVALWVPGGMADGGHGEAGLTVVPRATSSTVAEIGRTRMLVLDAIAVGEPGAAIVTVEPAGVLDIVSGPMMVEGRPLGYLRVRGVAAGDARVVVGGQEVQVEVLAPRVGRSQEHLVPRIVAPLPGAWVWGRFAVGMERHVEPLAEEGRMFLRLSDGSEVEASRTSDASLGPDRRAVFEVDAESVSEGRVLLTPVVRFDGGAETLGEPVEVIVASRGSLSVMESEAEAQHNIVRPRRFQDAGRPTARSPEASGGLYFVNNGAYPAVCIPVEVDHAGHYQVFVRAMGTLAGGELPWVDVVVDGAQFPVTGAPLVTMRWHRLAVGTPVWLEAGVRIITPFFANDFYVEGVADRNLMLDTVEIARVGPSEAPGEDERLDGESGLVILPLDRASSTGGGGAMSAMSGGAMGQMPGAMQGGAMGAMQGGSMQAGAMVAMVQGAGPGTADDPMGLSVVPIRIALDRPLDGLEATGDLQIDAQAWTPQVRGTASDAPEVLIFVNGREVGRQRTFAPRFIVGAGDLDVGDNHIELVAMTPPGPAPVRAEARTPPQRIRFHPDPSSPRAEPTRDHRYGIHDPAWDDRARALRRNEHHPRERAAAAMYSQETIRLALPAELEGAFEIGVETMGTHFEGAPELTIVLERPGDGEPSPLGVIRAPTWWDTRFLSRRAIEAGPKTLAITFSNDRFEPGVGDRNVWVQAVVLREVHATPDRFPPAVELLYPSPGVEVYMADAVVVRATDDRRLDRIELLVNGEASGSRRWVGPRAGPLVLPLLARDLDPGEHTLTVRAIDAAGNPRDSAPVVVRVLAEEPEGGTAYDRAITLLDRFAFGPDARELAAILSMGGRAWLEDRLSRAVDDAGDLSAMAQGLIRFEDGRYDYGPPRRALEHACHTPNPVRARFVLWAQNHFSTWIRKAEGDRKWREHVEFARLGAAPFHDLLLASARSPAMLRYLDQDRSFAGRLNENYAREILELHTMGVHGGYTQEDVTTLAALITGWTASTLGEGRAGGAPRGLSFRFDPASSSAGPATALGMAFPETARADRYDRVLTILEALAAHPSTARHIARRLAEAYAATPAPEGLVRDLALVFERTGGDTRAMLLAMSEHPEFWAAARERRLAHPLDYALRLSRTTGWVNPWRLSEYLQLSGAQIFDRSTPDGYPTHDAAYSDSNALVQRWSLAQSASGALVNLAPDTLRREGLSPDQQWAQRVVDSIAIGLTGRILSARSNQAAVDLLLESDAPISRRIAMIAPLVAQMPDANLK